MRKLPIIFAAVLSAFLLTAGLATAKSETNEAKQLARQACKDEKKADKQAFKAIHGKRAMRTCIKGEKSEVKGEKLESKQACKTERDALGDDAFAEKYGTNGGNGNDKGKQKGAGKNAFGKCVSSKMKEEQDSDTEAFKNAAKECKAERSDNPEAFKDKYGTNENGKNAFGKCVSSKAQEADDADESEGEQEDPPTE